MEALGRHILLELYACDATRINDLKYVEKCMLSATKASGATIIDHNIHQFSPHGVSGVVLIAESHVSIHTWPEHEYAAVDVFTCGKNMHPRIICNNLKSAFDSKYSCSKDVRRGLCDPVSDRTFKPK